MCLLVNRGIVLLSVGSLGQNPAVADEVKQIYFQNCICENTMNCARIKTWAVINSIKLLITFLFT